MLRPPADPVPVERARSSATLTIAPAKPAAEAGLSKSLFDPRFRAAVINTTRKIALSFTLGFLFFRFSFVHEFLTSKYAIDPHILLILGAFAMLACLASGQAVIGLGYMSVRMYMLFFVCMCLGTLFSSYHEGSLNVLLPYAKTTLPLLFLIPAVAFTAEDIKKAINVIGIAGATAIVVGLFREDTTTNGRLQLDSVNGTIQNANDFATHIVLVAPAIAYVAFQRGRNPVFKALGIGVLAIGAYELLGTGSRGGFIAILISAIYLFFKGSPKMKTGLIVGVPLLAAAILPFVPSSSVQRMTALFSSQDQTEEAASSRAARIDLLKASIDITISHPLFGIGPGEFEDYQGGMAAAEGQKGMWHETHNAYTQVSSECGIPALLFYVSGMFLTFRSLRRATMANLPEVSVMARTVAVMMVGYAVNVFFLSQAYSFALIVMCGVSVCLERFAQQHEATPVSFS